MTNDFYCDEALSGRTPVEVVRETADVLAAEVAVQYGACRVVTNLGRYQDSKHLHFHVGFGDPRK
jgi:histidine triad (HIT) family protein